MLAPREDLSHHAAAIDLSERDAATHDGASDNEFRSPGLWRPLLPSRRNAVAFIAAGLLVTAVASFGLVDRGSPVPGGTSADTRPTPSALVASGVAVGGPSDVAAQMSTYAPGQSSGWHTHTGLHAVVVLAGTLTIVDGECQPHVYGPGESYVGGRDVHLAVNQGSTPLEMAVTNMFPAGISHTSFHVPARPPAGCEVG